MKCMKYIVYNVGDEKVPLILSTPVVVICIIFLTSTDPAG